MKALTSQCVVLPSIVLKGVCYHTIVNSCQVTFSEKPTLPLDVLVSAPGLPLDCPLGIILAAIYVNPK